MSLVTNNYLTNYIKVKAVEESKYILLNVMKMNCSAGFQKDSQVSIKRASSLNSTEYLKLV